MSLQSIFLNFLFEKSDRKRDSMIPVPEGVTEFRNISYGPHGKWNLLDVYYPEGTAAALPTIVSIHGGGYVYGTKEIYRRYGMDLARRGFAFVNFNYRLAPKAKFPAPLEDTNAVLQWLCQNAEAYHLDPSRIILVGDSAGAQLASQYAAIAVNPEYAALFPFSVPEIHIRALGLYCGMYDMAQQASTPRKGIQLDYLGAELPADDPRFRVLESITASYPPTFIVTAYHDFLRGNAEPMYDFLESRGIKTKWKCYGSEDNKKAAHVFHVNIVLPEAIECNDDSADFFKQYI